MSYEKRPRRFAYVRLVWCLPFSLLLLNLNTNTHCCRTRTTQLLTSPFGRISLHPTVQYLNFSQIQRQLHTSPFSEPRRLASKCLLFTLGTLDALKETHDCHDQISNRCSTCSSRLTVIASPLTLSSTTMADITSTPGALNAEDMSPPDYKETQRLEGIIEARRSLKEDIERLIKPFREVNEKAASHTPRLSLRR